MSPVILSDLYCEKCSLQFNKKYVFDLHLSLVHGKEIKVKTEPTTSAENIDEVLSDKLFQCDKCNSFFKSKPNLKRHIASVHERE